MEGLHVGDHGAGDGGQIDLSACVCCGVGPESVDGGREGRLHPLHAEEAKAVLVLQARRAAVPGMRHLRHGHPAHLVQVVPVESVLVVQSVGVALQRSLLPLSAALPPAAGEDRGDLDDVAVAAGSRPRASAAAVGPARSAALAAAIGPLDEVNGPASAASQPPAHPPRARFRADQEALGGGRGRHGGRRRRRRRRLSLPRFLCRCCCCCCCFC